MRRRSRASGEPAKTRGRKVVTPKWRTTPKAVRRRSSSAAGQKTEISRLTRELHEAWFAMSAFDPKRTSTGRAARCFQSRFRRTLDLLQADEVKAREQFAMKTAVGTNLGQRESL